MLLEKLFKFGVIPRAAARNYPSELKDLLHKKWVQKARKKGRVFYELTEKAVPLAEEYRLMLFHKTRIKAQVTPHSKFYRSLLGELRFLDDQHPLVLDYQLLGDWQLTRPLVPSQLALAKLRYYQQQNLL